MIEKKLKNEYRIGVRKGITELDDYFYMPVRITGTGYNLRQKDNELILADRNQSEFFSKEFIEHCKSLPIIINHPSENDMLNSENLKDNAIIGNTIDAYIKSDELWGLARIYDKNLLNLIKSGELKSTSPGVRIFYDENADPIANSEIPYDINHLAFCEKGHWDNDLVSDKHSKGFDDSTYERLKVSYNTNDKQLILTNDNKFDNLSDEKTLQKGTQMTQKDEALHQNTNDVAPVIAGAVGGMAASKATDGELEIKHMSDGGEGDNNLVPEQNKANDAYESNENKLKHAVQNSGTPTFTKDSEIEAEVNDADNDIVGKNQNLEKAASIMANASHAGLPSQNKAEEKPVSEDVKKEEVKEDKKEEVKEDEKEQKANDSEVVDSENETEDDKERESELKKMRSVCDSADANLGVKMPYISGRQTLRSIAHKFVTANKGFVDKKYANLALDSYTPELAREVLQSVYDNIASKSETKPQVSHNGYVMQPDGSMIKFD